MGSNLPRTYRHKARKNYLKVAKAKSLNRNVRKVRKQLCYLRRNSAIFKLYVEEGLWQLDTPRQVVKRSGDHRNFRQQSELNAQKSNQIDDRMVRIEQLRSPDLPLGWDERMNSAVRYLPLDKGFAYLETVSVLNEAGTHHPCKTITDDTDIIHNAF